MYYMSVCTQTYGGKTVALDRIQDRY